MITDPTIKARPATQKLLGLRRGRFPLARENSKQVGGKDDRCREEHEPNRRPILPNQSCSNSVPDHSAQPQQCHGNT